jgi:hypothetical protein
MLQKKKSSFTGLNGEILLNFFALFAAEWWAKQLGLLLTNQ